MESDGGASGQRVLGCSRCRYSLKGCSRCKKPTFTHRGPRQHAAGSASGSRAANGSSKGAATSPDDADAAPRPAQRERRRRPHHTPRHLQQHHHYQQYSQQLNDPYQQPLSGTEEEVQDPKALMQGVAFELTQLEQLQQDISTMQHRKRARTQLAADRPEGHGDLAKRLRTSLLGPAGAAGWAPGPAQAAAAAAAAGGGAHQQQHHSSSFARTLEARVKAFAESGRRSVLTSPCSAKAGGDGFHAAAASPADSAAAAAAQAAKVKAEADLADMAAELGALAAAVSDDGGDTSAGAADAAGAVHQHQHQQQCSDDSAGGFGTPSSSVDTAEAEAAAAAAAGSPVSPGGSSKSPGARRHASAVKAKAYAHLLLRGVNPREPVPGWQAPASPFGLLEEELWQNPWQLLLGCMLLNKTSGTQVRRVFWKLLELCPTPEAAVAADTGAIRDIIAPLGLHNKRAVAVQRLSHDYLEKDWTCPTELYGIGKYAADAYYMFCRGQWEGVQPDDKDLIKYHEWMRATGGQGMALEPPAAAAAAAAAGQAQAVADEQAGVLADAAGTGSTAVVAAGGGAAGDAGAEADGEGAPEVAEGHVAAGSSPDAPAPDAAGAAGDSAAADAAGAAGDSAAADAAGAAGDSAAAEAAGEQAAGDAGVIEQAELLV